MAADNILVPVPPQHFSLIGLRHLISFLGVLLQRMDEKSVYVVPNLVDNRMKTSIKMFEALKDGFKGNILPEIRTSGALPDSQAHKQPVVHFKSRSRGAKDFKRLADYILKSVKPTV